MLKVVLCVCLATTLQTVWGQSYADSESAAEDSYYNDDSGAAEDSYYNDDSGAAEDSYYNDDNGGDDPWAPPYPDKRCWGQGQGRVGEDGQECGDCPPGTYNFEGSRVDNCIPCSIGQYSDEAGSDYCRWCSTGSTAKVGSTSEECIDPDKIVSNFAQATVTLDIAVDGKDLCTGIEELLWGVSHVLLWNGHFSECRVVKVEGIIEYTAMKVEITPPANIAWQIYSGLKFVEVHREVVSEYAKLGSFYAKQVMNYINLLSGMRDYSFLGLDLDYDMLDIENIDLRSFKVSFKGHCNFAATDDDIFCNSQEEGSDEAKEVFPVNYYAHFTLSGRDFDLSNADIVKMSNRVKKDENILPCAKSGTCDVSMVDIKENSVYVQFSQISSNQQPIEMGEDWLDWTWTYVDGSESVTLSVSKYMRGCNVHTKGMTLEDLEEGFNSNSGEDDGMMEGNCKSCGAGHFINKHGMCEKCPWGSWGDDGIQCNSCGWSYITPFWGMESKDKCIQTDNGMFYDWSSYPGHPAGQNSITLGGTPSMNMCGPVHAKKELDKKCLELFSAEDLEWPENINLQMWTIERVVCSASTLSGPLFQEFCGEDWDKTTDEVMQGLVTTGNWMDLICYPLKRVVDLEAAETSDDCSGLDEETYRMDVDINLPAMGIDAKTSEVLVPLLSGMKNLETMNFGSFSDAGEAMMKAMGMYDMNAMTGWNIANNLRDVVMTMPRGFRMRRFSFSTEYREEEHFCEDGEAKRDCWGNVCDEAQCVTTDSDSVKYYCEVDECGCTPKFYYYVGESKVDVKDDRCASCDFVPDIENGKLVKVYGNNVEAMYMCNKGWVPADCNSLAKCDYGSGENSITYPKCVPDQCEWPENVENGYFYSDWRDESGIFSDSSCPYKRYTCNSGYYTNNGEIKCDVGNNFATSQPGCTYYGGDDEYYDGDDDGEDGGDSGGDSGGESGGESGGDSEEKTGCHFPEYIARGERYMIDEESNIWATYVCYYPYVMSPNKAWKQIGMDSTVSMAKQHERFSVAYCYEDTALMPECKEPEEARHCGLPAFIYNGKAVQVMFPADIMEDADVAKQQFDDDVMKMMKEVMNDVVMNSYSRDEMMPFMARYECDEGYVMMETMRGDMGWCRGDGSMELPSCVKSYEWNEVKFKLAMSKEMKMVDKEGNAFGGIVQAMQVDFNDKSMHTEGEWEYACNDGFNDYAAGAICRTQGYRHGMKMELPKKAMKSFMQESGVQSEDQMMSFGWTGFACEYDDTLANSKKCSAARYDDASEKHGMKAACFAFDVMAVKCFNDNSFKVDVDLSFTVRKLTCGAKGLKKDTMIDLSAMGAEATFKIDGKQIDADVFYKKKKGFTAKYNMRPHVQQAFNCITCEIHAGDMLIGEDKYCV